MSCLQIGGLRTHKMRKFKSDRFIISSLSGSFQFKAKLLEFNRQKLNWHIPVKRFGIGPALHVVFAGELLVDRKKIIQLMVINMPILKSNRIDNLMYFMKYLIPFALMFLYRYKICFRQPRRCSHYGFLTVNPR